MDRWFEVVNGSGLIKPVYTSGLLQMTQSSRNVHQRTENISSQRGKSRRHDYTSWWVTEWGTLRTVGEARSLAEEEGMFTHTAPTFSTMVRVFPSSWGTEEEEAILTVWTFMSLGCSTGMWETKPAGLYPLHYDPRKVISAPSDPYGCHFSFQHGRLGSPAFCYCSVSRSPYLTAERRGYSVGGKGANVDSATSSKQALWKQKICSELRENERTRGELPAALWWRAACFMPPVSQALSAFFCLYFQSHFQFQNQIPHSIV